MRKMKDLRRRGYGGQPSPVLRLVSRSLGEGWWRRGELNPCPKCLSGKRLHVYLADFFRKEVVRQPLTLFRFSCLVLLSNPENRSSSQPIK